MRCRQDICGLSGTTNPADGVTVDTDKFISSYGIAWKNFSDTPGAAAAVISGYAGIRLYTGNAERARLDSAGNFLVGIVNAGSWPSGGVVLGPGASSAILVGHSTSATSGSYFGAFGYGGATIGYIAQNGTTGVSYVTSSDYRLKSDVTLVTSSGAFIDALKPCTWTWISDGTPGAGFIAHELQAVSPTSVTGTKDGIQAIGDLKSPTGELLQTGIPQPMEAPGGQIWVQTGARPIYQAVEYGSAEVIAMMVAELQALRRRLRALDGN